MRGEIKLGGLKRRPGRRDVSVSIGCPRRPVEEDAAPYFDAIEFFV